MRNFLILSIGCVLTIVVTIAFMPTILFSTFPDCEASTTFILEETDRTVVSSGLWNMKYIGEKGVGRYHGSLSIYPKSGEHIKDERVSISFETINKIMGPLIKTETDLFSVNHDNTASTDDIFHYVYKGLEINYKIFNRIQLINNEIYSSGLLAQQPRTTCKLIK